MCLGIDTRVNSNELFKTSRMVSSYTGMLVQANKAIIGANAFAHESGIHQDGVIKERETFEIIDATTVGLSENRLVLGKLSGRRAFRQRLEELGYHLSDQDLNQSFERFKNLADKKKDVSDRDIEALVADEVRGPVEVYRLGHVQVSCGDHSIPTATVTLIGPDDATLTDSATGTGPVDAVYEAINRVILVPNKLIEFSVQSVHRRHRRAWRGHHPHSERRAHFRRTRSQHRHHSRQRPRLHERLEQADRIERRARQVSRATGAGPNRRRLTRPYSVHRRRTTCENHRRGVPCGHPGRGAANAPPAGLHRNSSFPRRRESTHHRLASSTSTAIQLTMFRIETPGTPRHLYVVKSH